MAEAQAKESSSDAINLTEKFQLFSDHWSPKLIATMNDNDIKLAKVKGEFTWHSHADTDELFLVIEGSLVIQLRHKDVSLKKVWVVPSY
jgi:mannose-6-phosphate isomerase-like protein (cupin superfamily)